MLKRDLSRLSLVLLALTLLVVHYRLLLGDTLFWGLPSLQFYPWRELAFSLLREGQLPLWNAFNGADAPLFANYQSALLYPFTWLGFILPLAQTMSLTAVLHLFIAGWGMWRLMGRFGANNVGRGISAFAFGMTGYLVARLGTFPTIYAAAWLPWLVWAAHDLLTTGSRRSAAWLALFTALQLLAGHAQTTWYSLGIVGLYALWQTFTQRPFAWRRLLMLVGCLMLGAGVAALQLAATAELLAQSQRSSGVDYWRAMNFSYGPARTLNFLSPIIFGTPADGSYFTQGAYFEDAVYIGLIPLVAAFAAVFGWWHRRSEALAKTVPFWIMIVIIGFVLALGQYFPVFPFLYEHVPTFAQFQAPVRWHLWTVFGLSVLAGVGATWWRGGSRRQGRWVQRLMVVCVGTGLVGLVMTIMPATDNPALWALARSLLITSIFGLLAGWLTLRKPVEDSPQYPRWRTTLFIIVALDMGLASWGLNPTVPAAFYEPLSGQSDSEVRSYIPQALEDQLKISEYFRFNDYRVAVDRWHEVRAAALPNLNIVDRQPLLNNFDPLLSAHYVQFINLIERPPNNDALLAAAGVGAQRVQVVASICWHETQSDLEAAMISLDWQPSQQAHIPGDGGCEPINRQPAGSAVITQDSANEVIISTTMQRDGWLILADSDYPGWTASVDGEPTPIYRANVMFRAVQVSAGEHQVVFAYRPAWLIPAALVSVISLLLLVLLFRLKNVTPAIQSE